MAYSSKNWMPARYTIFRLPKQSKNTVKAVLHTFNIGDVEDPWLYASAPITEWKNTEQGKWCMENCEGEMVLHTQLSLTGWGGWTVAIQGELSYANLTYLRLKWGAVSSHS